MGLLHAACDRRIADVGGQIILDQSGVADYHYQTSCGTELVLSVWSQIAVMSNAFWLITTTALGILAAFVGWRLAVSTQRVGFEQWRFKAVLSNLILSVGSAAFVYAAVITYALVRGDGTKSSALVRVDLLVAALVLAVSILLTSLFAVLQPGAANSAWCAFNSRNPWWQRRSSI